MLKGEEVGQSNPLFKRSEIKGFNPLRLLEGRGYWACVMYLVGFFNWMTTGEWCLATAGFWVSHTSGSTWEAGRGKDVLISEDRGARRSSSCVTGESGTNRVEGAKEMEAPNLVRRSLPKRGTGQVGRTRNE